MNSLVKKLQAPWLPLTILLVLIGPCNSSFQLPVVSGLNIFDLHPGLTADFTDLANEWTVTGLIDQNQRVFTCDLLLLGGPGILQLNSIMQRTYTNLPSHNFISYAFRIYVFGNWQSTDSIQLYTDGVATLQWFPSTLFTLESLQSCGAYGYVDIFDVGTFPHASSSFQITIVSNVPSSTSGATFGIRGARFMLKTSTTDITKPSCIQPRTKIGFGCGCPYRTYSSSPGVCTVCSATCSTCTGPSSSDCYVCDWNHYYDGHQCQSCTPNCILCSGSNSNQCAYCGIGYRLNWDGTCSLTTDPCPSPYTSQSSGGFVVCNAQCHLLGQFTYKDGSCSPTCNLPFTPRIVGTAEFCDGPCSDPSYFYYPAYQLCKPTCPYPYQEDGVSFCILKISQEDATQLETIGNILNVGAYGIPGAAMVLSVLNAGNPGAFSLAMLADILKYIKFLNITYPPKLQFLLDQDNPSIDIIPPIPNSIEVKFTKHEMPGKFEQYENHSSFLVHFWQNLIWLAVILVGAGISSFIATKTKQWKFVGFFWLKMKRWLKWNFFLMTISSYFDDIITYSSLEFRTYSTGSDLSYLSFAICIFTNLLTVIVLAKMIRVVIEVRNIYSKRDGRPLKSDLKKWEDYSMLFKSYKEKNLFAQGFFIFFLARVIIFYAVIAYLFDYPLVQTISITCLSLITLCYIGIARPFKNLIDLASNFIQEFLVLIVNVCTMLLAIFYVADSSNYEDRLIPGDIIIYCNIVFTVFGLVSLVVQIFVLLWNIYQIIRSGFSKDKIVEKAGQPHSNALDESAQRPLPETNSLSPSLAKYRSSSNSNHNWHSQNVNSNARLEFPNSLSRNNNTSRVKRVKKPTALERVKLAQSEKVKEDYRSRKKDTLPATTKHFSVKRIYRPEIQYSDNKTETPARNIYEMLRNEARLQTGGANYNR